MSLNNHEMFMIMVKIIEEIEKLSMIHFTNYKAFSIMIFTNFLSAAIRALRLLLYHVSSSQANRLLHII